MSEERQTLVIDREVWLRGDPFLSKLLDDRGKRCCVGIYLQSCGMADEVLRDMRSVDGLVATYGDEVLPERARWMYDGRDVPKWNRIYNRNDATGVDEDKREADIAAKFAAYGVDVTFINSRSPS
jgi:hypothetical protein